MASHDRVTDNIWLGGRLSTEAWRQLWAEGVRVVVSLQEEQRNDYGDLLPEAELWLPAPDMGMPTIYQMWLACAFIHRALLDGRKVVVHCRYGVGRSPMTLAAYFVTQGWEPRQAVDYLTRHRPEVDPNGRQWAVLEAFARQWRAGNLPPLDAGSPMVEQQ
ncbi:MAG: dual specificity protein phosphatase family protein [Armatimonadetes bacterium]|nr:dual specificity protein phosphatase family protein [Armatimonadota bacterium]